MDDALQKIDGRMKLFSQRTVYAASIMTLVISILAFLLFIIFIRASDPAENFSEIAWILFFLIGITAGLWIVGLGVRHHQRRTRWLALLFAWPVTLFFSAVTISSLFTSMCPFPWRGILFLANAGLTYPFINMLILFHRRDVAAYLKTSSIPDDEEQKSIERKATPATLNEHDDAKKVFTFEQNKIDLLKSTSKRRYILFSIATLCLLGGLFYYQTRDLPVVLIALMAVGGGLFLSVRRSLHNGSLILQRYTITCENDRLVRNGHAQEPVAIPRVTVTRIEEIAGCGLLVHTMSKKKKFFIPAQIDGYSELKAKLETWHPISEKPRLRHHPVVIWMMMGLGAAIPLGVFYLHNPAIKLIFGVTALIGGGYIFFNFGQDINLPANVKNSRWLILIVAIFLFFRSLPY